MTADAARGRIRNFAINALLALIGLVIPLLLCEAYLRWDNRQPPVPLYSIDLAGRTYWFVERPEALADVHDAAVIIGDSFTAGLACGADGSYPRALGRFFAKNHQPYRALNLGVPGSDPFDYLHLVERLLASGRVPAMVVVTMNTNDIELLCSAVEDLDRVRQDPAFTPQEIARLEALRATCQKAHGAPMASFSPIRRIHTWITMKSDTYGVIRDGLVALSMRFGFNSGWGRTAYPQLWKDHAGLEYKMMAFALAHIRDDLAARGVQRVMFTIYPDAENIGRDNPYVAIFGDLARDLSRTLGVPVHSGYEALLVPRGKRNMIFSIVDHHPNRLAHELYAEGVDRWLGAAGYLGR